MLTCSDVLRNPDGDRDRGVDGPDASFGCRKATGGRRAGRQEQAQDGDQGGQQQTGPAPSQGVWRPAAGHSLSLAAAADEDVQAGRV